MSASFSITLPLPPSVNNLHTGSAKNKRRSPNYISWVKEAGWRMNELRAGSAYKPLPHDCWYWVDVRLPENHLGDSDNRLKALHDLLHEMGATPDDKWLLGGTYMRSSDVKTNTCAVSAVSLPGGVSERGEELVLLARRILAWSDLPETALVEHRGAIS
ncbi:MAG: hypothetical protein MRY81_10205 [Donghicola eburneus]|nr:hypothetical protein [Donghicola eburneus]MCI5040044.1 hypothetical protein [Donghicola eburneus]